MCIRLVYFLERCCGGMVSHAQAQVRAQAQLLLLHAGKIERINQQFKRFEINKQETKKELSFGDSKQTNKKQPT